jgi:hypothetical protein
MLVAGLLLHFPKSNSPELMRLQKIYGPTAIGKLISERGRKRQTLGAIEKIGYKVFAGGSKPKRGVKEFYLRHIYAIVFDHCEGVKEDSLIRKLYGRIYHLEFSSQYIGDATILVKYIKLADLLRHRDK